MTSPKKYCLFDASAIVPYYIPNAHSNRIVHDRMVSLVEAVRSKAAEHFFYIPNFCIAEVFSTFAKYAHGEWNKHVKGKRIDGRVHQSLRRQFQKDIHNASLFYHYELSRYHVLAVNLVAPVDHYFKLRRTKQTVSPASTFDHLIVAMGIHLTKIHGPESVVIITADNRLAKLVTKCRSDLSATARREMKIRQQEEFVGIQFCAESFPLVLDLAHKKADFLSVFGQWPLPCSRRYLKPYHLKS